MCFHLNRQGEQPSIATKDITCRKVLEYNVFFEYWQSPYQLQIYEFNTLYSVKMDGVGYWTTSIYKGLHSYQNKYFVGVNWTYSKDFIAIIPKGSKYHKNLEGQYVSNQLIVFRHRLQYYYYKLKQLFKKN